jgi:hypothetical protein
MSGATRERRLEWLQVALFQIVWFACAIGASSGSSWPGLLTAAVAIGVHLAAVSDCGRALKVIAICAVAGIVFETLLVASGAVRYAAPWPSPAFAPAWIVALWATLGMTLDATRRLLAAVKVPMLAALGAIFGPLSYLAGARLGALDLGPSPIPSLIAVSAVWAAVLPLLLRMTTGRKPEVLREEIR